MITRSTMPVLKKIHSIFSSVKGRQDILNIEQWVRSMPTSYKECPYPLFHNLENGLYIREIHMKAGDLVCSRIHKDEYPVAMLKGKNWFVNEFEFRELTGPSVFKVRGGAKNMLFILEDTVWIDTHKVKSSTIEDAEKEIFCDSYEEYDAYHHVLSGERLCLAG